MNYLMEIKMFYERQLERRLPAAAIAVWHALMEINNRAGWKEWFSAPMQTLMLFSGMSRQTVYRSLEKLIAEDYIAVVDKSGDKSGDKDGDKSGDKRVYKLATLSVTKPAGHLINNNKLNETKQNYLELRRINAEKRAEREAAARVGE